MFVFNDSPYGVTIDGEIDAIGGIRNDSYIELYSKSLIDKFGDAFTQYEKGKIYRIFGGVVPDKQSLYFDLKKFKLSEYIGE